MSGPERMDGARANSEEGYKCPPKRFRADAGTGTGDGSEGNPDARQSSATTVPSRCRRHRRRHTSKLPKLLVFRSRGGGNRWPGWSLEELAVRAENNPKMGDVTSKFDGVAR